MDLKNRKIDDFIENKLRQASLVKTRGDFTAHLMKKLESEYKSALEETRRERIAKYVIGAFSSLIIIFTVFIGYLAKSDVSSTIESTNIRIEPTLQSSTNYFEQFINFIQKFFMDVLAFFGFSVSPQTINIFAGLIVVFMLFFLADRIFLKGKLKSIHS